jgi:hypothetical protein
MRLSDANPWTERTVPAGLGVMVVNSYLQANKPGWAGREPKG